MARKRTLALLALFSLLALLSLLTGCDGPHWRSDDFRISGEMTGDGRCSITVDPRLGEPVSQVPQEVMSYDSCIGCSAPGYTEAPLTCLDLDADHAPYLSFMLRLPEGDSLRPGTYALAYDLSASTTSHVAYYNSRGLSSRNSFWAIDPYGSALYSKHGWLRIDSLRLSPDGRSRTVVAAFDFRARRHVSGP